ncbi:MAG: CSLREA domain-containing protein, partial [Ardenticatenaceae bacterium]
MSSATLFHNPHQQTRIPFVVGLLLLVAVLAFGIPAVGAAPTTTIVVNSTADVLADDGQCTLREAITAANTDTASGSMGGECAAGSGADTIVLPFGTYTLQLAGAAEDDNATGDLDIFSDLTLQPEMVGGQVTVDGATLDRVFHVQAGATVEVTGLLIPNGKTPNG